MSGLKISLLGSLCVLLGFFAALTIFAYASPVLNYNARIPVREDLVNSSVDSFTHERYSDSAVLMLAANQVASRRDESWPFFFPLRAFVIKITGAFDYIRVPDDYRKQEVAYLYEKAGEREIASQYYEELEKRSGKTRAQVDRSASAFLKISQATKQ